MDISPEMWVAIIFGATAVAGALMWWSSKPKARR